MVQFNYLRIQLDGGNHLRGPTSRPKILLQPLLIINYYKTRIQTSYNKRSILLDLILQDPNLHKDIAWTLQNYSIKAGVAAGQPPVPVEVATVLKS